MKRMSTKTPRERAREAGFKQMHEHAAELIERYQREPNPSPHIVLGPIVWQPAENGERLWYFIVVHGSDGGVCHCDQLGSREKSLTEEFRAAVFMACIPHRLVIHDFDDELVMAKWVEAIWPCEKSTQIRADMEAERSGARL
jgi:hypothetical protein